MRILFDIKSHTLFMKWLVWCHVIKRCWWWWWWFEVSLQPFKIQCIYTVYAKQRRGKSYINHLILSPTFLCVWTEHWSSLFIVLVWNPKAATTWSLFKCHIHKMQSQCECFIFASRIYIVCFIVFIDALSLLIDKTIKKEFKMYDINVSVCVCVFMRDSIVFCCLVNIFTKNERTNLNLICLLDFYVRLCISLCVCVCALIKKDAKLFIQIEKKKMMLILISCSKAMKRNG